MYGIERLKEAKKAQKLTLNELSLRSGIAKRTIEDIFQGKTANPRIDTMQAIEKALELSPNHAVILSDKELLMANIEILKQQKKQMKITFDELSLKSKIPKRTLQNIFNGVTENPRIDTMQAIEKALGLSPDFTEEEKALGLSPNHAVVLSDDDRYLIHLFAEAEETLGKAYVDGVLKMVELSIQQGKK